MIGVGLLVGLLWLPGLGDAVLAAPPPRTTATPLPIATPIASSVKKTDIPTGAFITLQTQAGTWSVVQWQDANGDWHDVGGWRGSVVDGSVQWWVAQKDFGTGPFRWAVYQFGGGELTAASEAFHLPAGTNDTLDITVP